MIATPELIEKVARALHGAKTRWFRWERVGEPRRRRVRKQAIAVLKALGYRIEAPKTEHERPRVHSGTPVAERVRAPRVPRW